MNEWPARFLGPQIITYQLCHNFALFSPVFIFLSVLYQRILIGLYVCASNLFNKKQCADVNAKCACITHCVNCARDFRDCTTEQVQLVAMLRCSMPTIELLFNFLTGGDGTDAQMLQ